MNPSAIQSSRENVYFVFSLIVSILIYVAAAVSIFGIAIALGVFVLLLFVNAMMLGSIRGNGIRIHERQFPDVYARVLALSKEMGIKKVPDVFVIQSEGALNAFATRFFGRDMVVLYSEVFELAREEGQEELDFILAHELAHIKRRHVWKNLLLLPAAFVPFLSQAYSRSCEYTCDRHAAYVIQNPAAAKRALTLLGIGKKMYREVNEDAYLEQIQTESNGIVWYSEVMSTHPNLPKRIQAIGQFVDSGVRLYKPDQSKIALGAVALFVTGTIVYFFSIGLFAGAGVVYSQLLPNAFSEGWSEDYVIEGETALMTAAMDGDPIGVEQALADGEDLYAVDSEGSDALMYAVYSGNPDVIQLLIDAGADVNTSDDYSSALMIAVMYEDYASARLLVENGADPHLMDADGMTPMEYVGAASAEEFEEMLKAN
ncbi:heat-shock protein HtpX [Planococcus lenghuensis]|uniref:Heat-shock protein HtpX n=2 Tax=Planococcus lenghuensis TaxID=2213202 RepID=A0A1Q2L3J2_9BACL|nr:heat-shock protein HtpX [Planococcus lenghuensis]